MKQIPHPTFVRLVPHLRQRWLVRRAVCVLTLIGLVVMPNVVWARSASIPNACCANMKQIDGAKATWALEEKKEVGAVPTAADLFGATQYILEAPQCPLGGEYGLNAVGEEVTCSIHGTIKALKHVVRTEAQTARSHRLMLMVLVLGLGGGLLSVGVTKSRARWQEAVAVGMPLVMTAMTFYLIRGRFTYLSSEVVHLSILLTILLSARAVFLPRLGQRVVGWVIGTSWAACYVLATVFVRCR